MNGDVTVARPLVAGAIAPTPRARRSIIRPGRVWWGLPWQELWHYREVLYFLVWRDLKVRYKQSALGVLWVMLQPLGSMLIFTAIFHYFLRVDGSQSVPYHIFVYSALVPWFYFSSSLTRCVDSVVVNANLVSKIYFPRIFIPTAAVLTGLVDFGIGFLFLLAMMVVSGVAVGSAILAVPLALFTLVGTALGLGLWLSALNVRYRDVRHIAPFIVQLWMYVTPVIYPISYIPERWQWLFHLNPLVSVIEISRTSAVGDGPEMSTIVASLAFSLLLLTSGVLYFQYAEQDFADVI